MMDNEDERYNVMVTTTCLIGLWCGFLLLNPVHGTFSLVVSGFSGFLLVVLSVLYFILLKVSNASEVAGEGDEVYVTVELETYLDFLKSHVFLNSLVEKGIEDWDGYPEAVDAFQESITEMIESSKES